MQAEKVFVRRLFLCLPIAECKLYFHFYADINLTKISIRIANISIPINEIDLWQYPTGLHFSLLAVRCAHDSILVFLYRRRGRLECLGR
jgi:hypothetical protein